MVILMNMIMRCDAPDSHVGGEGSGVCVKLATDMERVHSKYVHIDAHAVIEPSGEKPLRGIVFSGAPIKFTPNTRKVAGSKPGESDLGI
jgi:hypothetical protein